ARVSLGEIPARLPAEVDPQGKAVRTRSDEERAFGRSAFRGHDEILRPIIHVDVVEVAEGFLNGSDDPLHSTSLLGFFVLHRNRSDSVISQALSETIVTGGNPPLVQSENVGVGLESALFGNLAQHHRNV